MKHNRKTAALCSGHLLNSIIAFVICLSVLLSLVSCSSGKDVNKSSVSETAATVNGEAITIDELDFFRSRLRGKVISDFASRYEISDLSSFWESEYDGESPKKELDSLALEEAAKAKLTLILCRERGIYDKISWDALKEKAEKYNAEHKKGGVGLNSIDMDTFYLYYVENGKIELEKHIGGSVEDKINSLYKSADIVI